VNLRGRRLFDGNRFVDVFIFLLNVELEIPGEHPAGHATQAATTARPRETPT
jgi:hypothetical protein